MGGEPPGVVVGDVEQVVRLAELPGQTDRLGLPGVDYVFIARQDTADCPWPRLLDDMESALVTLRRRIVSGDIRPSQRSAARPSTKG